MYKDWEYDIGNHLVLRYANSLHSSGKELVKQIGTLSESIIECTWDLEGIDGTESKHPSFWSSTGEILSQHSKTGTKVKYGQCWVVANVAISLLMSRGFKAYPIYIINCVRSPNGNGGYDIIDRITRGENCCGAGTGAGRIGNGVDKYTPRCSELPWPNECDADAWNVHVMVEVAINGMMHVMDPSVKPISGPFPISSIRNNEASTDDSQEFRYMWSSICGVERRWKEYITQWGPVLYVYSVKNMTKVYSKRLGKYYDVTMFYKDHSQFWVNYNKTIPYIIHRCSWFRSIKEIISGQRYMIQLVFMNEDKKPIYIDRKSYIARDPDPLMIFPGSSYVSVFIKCDTRFWTQLIKLR